MTNNDELGQLYQQVILDHNKNPRNFGVLDSATHCADGFNPLCGDHVTIHATVDGDRVVDIKFSGTGCAISKSSASIMTTVLKGRTVEEAAMLFDRFHDFVTKDDVALSDADMEDLGVQKLAAFQGVREFPSRVKCASLAWHTMNSALKGEKSATTE